MFRKNLRALQDELQMQHQLGHNRSPRQVSRIDELRQQASQAPQGVSRAELEFLDSVSALDLADAEARRMLSEQGELRGYQQQVAQGHTPTNPERFQSLISKESDRRKKQDRQKMAEDVLRTAKRAGIGAAVVGAGGAALGTAAAMQGYAPFSLAAVDGDGELLAAQQYRIERELEERDFQDSLAQRTALAQTNLDNDLMAMQQKALFESNLQNSIQRQQANAMGLQGGGGVEVLKEIEAVAAGYMAKGVEPAKAIDQAIASINLDGRANQYI